MNEYTWLIIFTWSDGEAGVRIVHGTQERAEEALHMVRYLCDDGEARLIQLDVSGDDFAQIAEDFAYLTSDDDRSYLLADYIVTFTNGQQYRFAAESVDHALEQAEDAEPGLIVDNVVGFVPEPDEDECECSPESWLHGGTDPV
jgi:hypothetical protein